MTARYVLPKPAAKYLADHTWDLGGSPIKVALLASTFAPFPAWAASTAYANGVVRVPSTPNGHYYQAQNAGTSDASEPTWPTDGSTVADNDIVWEDLGTTIPVVGADVSIFGDVSADEISGTGYTAGGETLANVTLVEDPAGAKWTADKTTWTAGNFQYRWWVAYHPATLNGIVAPVISLGIQDDTPADVGPSGGDYELDWGVNGLMRHPVGCL